MKKHLSEFYSHLTTKHESQHYRYGLHKDARPDLLASHLQSLSLPEFRKLVSDPHWNSYPTYTWQNGTAKNSSNPKEYYTLISRAVKMMVVVSPKYREELIKHSEGIFRMATINSSLGKDKLKAARIAIKSRDTRVRKLAVKILPVKDLTPMLETEKDSSVLNKLAGRIGSLNMIEAGRRSKYRWSRSEAFYNDSLDMDEIRSFLEKKSSGKTIPVYEHNILTKVVYHLAASELPFALDVLEAFSSKDAEAKSLFMAKLTGQNDA